MPTNEEGEFELVLGNKQLLSVFFLIVLLLGVFFSMGYIVGRNTAPSSTQLASASRPLTVDPPTGAAAPPPDLSKPSPVKTEEAPVVREETPPPAPKPERVKERPAEPVAVAPPKPKPAPEPKPVVEQPKPAPTAAKPMAGKYYLQVAAVKDRDAATLSEVLGKRGFPTTTEPVPEKPLVRVLVGPFQNADAMNEAKSKLADFKPIPRKI